MSNDIAILQPVQGVDLVDIRRDTVRFPRIKTMAVQDVISALQSIFYMAMLYKAQTATEEQVTSYAAILYNELMNPDRKSEAYRASCSELTIEEITRAARNAALSLNTYTISVALIFQACLAYAKGPGMEAAKKARQAQQRSVAVDTMMDVRSSQIARKFKV